MVRDVNSIVLSKLTTANNGEKTKAFYTTSLRNIPKVLKTRFLNLKERGLVTGSMNDYIILSIIEKINKDEN